LRRRRDVGPAACTGLDQPVRDQHADRLAHRPDADRVSRGQLTVSRQLRARRELAADDLCAKAVRDRGREVRAPDGRSTRHGLSTVPNTEAANLTTTTPPRQRSDAGDVDKGPAP